MNPTVGSASCHFTDRTFPFTTLASGISAGSSLLAGTLPYLGQVELTTGPTTTGKAYVGTALTALTFSGREWVWEALVQIPVLSDATNSFRFCGGFMSAIEGGDNCAVFMYNHADDTRFTCLTSSSSEPPPPTPTTVTVTAGQWYRLKIVADLTTGWVKFYIDGTLATTLTSNLPSGASLGAGVSITKLAGTTARKVLCDWLVSDWRRASCRVVQDGDWSDEDTWENGDVPGDGDGVHIPAPYQVTIGSDVTVNQTSGSGPPFQIDNGARLLVGPDGTGSLTVTQNTLLVIDGDIDVWTWAKFGPILQVPFCEGRVRRMLKSAQIIIGDDGFKYTG